MGGAAVKKEDADAIGAIFGKNKEEGVEIAKKAMAEREIIHQMRQDVKIQHKTKRV